MKNSTWKLLSFRRVVTVIAILIAFIFMAAPVSASACHPGFVVKYPSSSFQFSQPSFSGIIITSPALNQGSAIQFSRPTFSSSAPVFLFKGKGYIPSNPFRW
jgi:hypothetical protein